MICFRYATATLPINYSGAAGHYGRGASGGIHRIFSGLRIRSLILIVLSSLCLVFASIFVCVCLRKSKFLSILRNAQIRKLKYTRDILSIWLYIWSTFPQSTHLILMASDTVRYQNPVPWKMAETEPQREVVAMGEVVMPVMFPFIPQNIKFMPPYKESSHPFHHLEEVVEVVLVMVVPKVSTLLTDWRCSR